MSLEIEFSRGNRCFFEGEVVSGNVVIKASSEFRFISVGVTLTGSVSLVEDPEYFPIINNSFFILKPSDGREKLGNNSTVPFSFSLKPLSPQTPLLETYYGSKLKIQYFVRFEVKKSGVISQSISKSLEIFIQRISPEILPPKKFSFCITPESIAQSSVGKMYNLREDLSIPDCRIYGTIDNVVSPLHLPLRGFIRVDETKEEIRSLEIRLMRAEFIPEGPQYSESLFKDTSEIQNLQICDGNILRELEVPIYMELPPNLSCSSIRREDLPFQIEFELHVMIVFVNDYVIMEKIPLKLWRKKT